MRRWIAAVLVALPLVGSAEFWTGNTLKRHLDTDAAITARGNRGSMDEAFDAGGAFGFVIGVHDVWVGVSVCTPTGVTAGQLLEIVRLYLRAVPHRLHENAEVLVKEALVRAFPCPQRPQSNPSRSL